MNAKSNEYYDKKIDNELKKKSWRKNTVRILAETAKYRLS